VAFVSVHRDLADAQQYSVFVVRTVVILGTRHAEIVAELTANAARVTWRARPDVADVMEHPPG
jgi:hypothetical protein